MSPWERLVVEADRSAAVCSDLVHGRLTVAVDEIDAGGERAQQRCAGLVLLHEARSRLYRRAARSAEELLVGDGRVEERGRIEALFSRHADEPPASGTRAR